MHITHLYPIKKINFYHHSEPEDEINYKRIEKEQNKNAQ